MLGNYVADALQKVLPAELEAKWRFRGKEMTSASAEFKGDGSRGGPARRELTNGERARL